MYKKTILDMQINKFKIPDNICYPVYMILIASFVIK